MNVLILQQFTHVYTMNIEAKNATIFCFESGFRHQIESQLDLMRGQNSSKQVKIFLEFLNSLITFRGFDLKM